MMAQLRKGVQKGRGAMGERGIHQLAEIQGNGGGKVRVSIKAAAGDRHKTV
jgi:hypothetical protein